MGEAREFGASGVGFLGAGRMAEAIVRGMIEGELCRAEALLASDVSEERRRVFASLGARTTEDNVEVVRECRVVVVAVKPQNLEALLPEVGPALTGDHVLITICAGCPTGMFEAAAAGRVRVVRAMPNLPMRVGLGATALCGGRDARAEDVALARRMFGAASAVVTVAEGLMDAVTALSGSGPAYVFYLAELMTEAGRREGLSEEVARTLAVETARGAAEMMAREDVPPEELRRRVTSKGGTTEAAFRSMADSKVGEGILKGVAAAVARARELGRE